MSLRPSGGPRLASLAAACLTIVALAACSIGRATTSQSSSPTSIGASCQPHAAPTGGFTPQQIRDAYGVTQLLQAGHTGKGQTVVLIESFGDPTLQQDVNTFDQQFCLPPITVNVLSPLGTKPFDPSNKDMPGWAGETALDVEIVHSIAPDAGIVVMTSPVDETEGTIGLPEFRQLEQQAISQHLGNVISQSWGVSEVTLTDQKGQAEIALWDAMYKAATQQGFTFTTGSGDNGATDYKDLDATQLYDGTTTSFPSDNQWVTSVGGTTLQYDGGSYSEVAWPDSGGGFSRFYPTPSFQQGLPASVVGTLANRRGVPDVSADGAPNSGWQIRVLGQWQTIGGTSAGAPFWAALVAIADQVAGHPIGNVNPALYHIGASGAYSQDFRDVTSGNNSVNTGSVQVQGYDAAPGWDPVTGLGSPIANKLLPDLVAATQSSAP